MNIKKEIVVFLLFCFSSLSFGQNPYSVEFNEVKGVLKNNDKFKMDFGKYHGYELPLYEGEKANFAVYSSEFEPRLILVDPRGKVYKQSGEAREGIATILTEIPISGDWILYVVGDKNDNGKFSLRYAFAAANSVNINKNMDLCSSLNFLIAHASAHFMMLPEEHLEKSGMELIGKDGIAEVDMKEGGLIITKYKGANEYEAKMHYSQLIERISNCLSDWTLSEYIQLTNNVSQLQEGKVFTNKSDPSLPKIVIEVFSNGNINSPDTIAYKVQITII